MRALVASALFAAALTTGLACGRKSDPMSSSPAASVALPQVSGALSADGLSAPVSVVRDRWGVPHITANSLDDLFFAQGFVQAQDRLFQMDLWRRSVQGRLSEVLGANFIERDAMTRRMQYRGAMADEWESYGPDTRRIAEAFTRGINAWIAASQDAWPDEFRLAGWTPERWHAEDLLNRTDAFVASAGAQDEVLRARLTAAIGLARVNAMLPRADGPAVASPGVDLGAITHILGETIVRAGTQPFFSGLAGQLGAGSNAWAVDGSRTSTGAPLLAVDPHRSFDAPSLRYLVHLTAPGWNVIGATSPWLPGVAIGHNERMAWGMTAAQPDVQDLYVERTNPVNPRQVEDQGRWVDMAIEPDAIAVKGRAQPFEYERQFTRHGVVVGLDRERHLAYTLRWSGAAPGGAAELGALGLDRAQTAGEFREALAHWKMPAVDVVFASPDGDVHTQQAALVPVRRGAAGALPEAGWSGANEWLGWTSLTQLPHSADGEAVVVSANGDPARTARIQALLSSGTPATPDGFEAVQRDIVAWTAGQLLPLLVSVRVAGSDVAEGRRRLLAWDRQVRADSADARLYVMWEQHLAQALAERRAPAEFTRELMSRLPLAHALMTPSPAWFDGDPRGSRDALLADGLASAVYAARSAPAMAAWTDAHRVSFAHPLGVSEAARRRFNVGPSVLDGYAGTVQAVSADGRVGPAFRAVFDAADWDRSRVVNAPGQSAWPASPHAADLAVLWAAGTSFPLAFSPTAVRSVAEDTLTLVPTRP